jgi:hypothetical protein
VRPEYSDAPFVLERPFGPSGRRKRKDRILLFELCGHKRLPSLANQRHILTRGRRRPTQTGNILVCVATVTDYQELLDYRRSVSGMYTGARGETADSTRAVNNLPVRIAAGEKRYGE